MKNIVFDIGNVLLSFQPNEFLDQYFDEDRTADLMTIIFASDEWVELDMGTMMIKDVIRSLSNQYPKYKDDITFVLKNWTEMLKPIPENVQLVYQLYHKGYHLYLLSNFHAEAIQIMFQKYDFFQLFKGGVISAYEHEVKPEEKIYHILLERYHLNPADSLFIDDSLSNIHTALRLGMHGIHLPYLADLEEELKKINI